MKQERFLAIETSSPRLSLALGTTNGVVQEFQGPLQWRHAESLFEGLKKLLGRAHWPVQSLTGVVVSIGPGSFTGIRIGLAAARALGQSLRIPVSGISSLQAIAAGALKPGGQVCAMVDALRGEVFTGLYAMDNRDRIKVLWKEQRLAFADLARKLKNLKGVQPCLSGDAIPLYKEQLGVILGKTWPMAPEEQRYPQAGDLLKLGAPSLSRKRPGSHEQVIPLYLRSAAAVERRKK